MRCSEYDDGYEIGDSPNLVSGFKKIKVPKQKNQKENNYIVVKKKKVFGNTFDTLKGANSLQVNQHFRTFVQHLNNTSKKEI